jgi:hypothetical protein
MMDTPKYFCVVLGEPTATGKNRIEEGWYRPADYSYAAYPEAGDVLLFYCTANYPGYEKQVPGIGVALFWEGEHERLRYRYLPLHQPIGRDVVMQKLTAEEQGKFQYLHHSQSLLFEIAATSFASVVDQHPIRWP